MLDVLLNEIALSCDCRNYIQGRGIGGGGGDIFVELTYKNQNIYTCK